jgi:glutamine amidotransferase
MIVIIDYGMGNLGSIRNMFNKIGVISEITNKKEKILDASKIILPGVGSFDTGMRNLQELGIIPLLNQKVIIEKTCILGICLGAQLMCVRSEEGILQGLGWFDADVLSFKRRFAMSAKDLPVPNMGWHDVFVEKASSLTYGLSGTQRYYFVHSYFMAANRNEDIMMTSEYGIKFASALQCRNITAVQFHPEKSHKFGQNLLSNFAKDI